MAWKLCGNAWFPQSFGRLSRNPTKLWVSTKFLHQEIRWNYGILSSGTALIKSKTPKVTIMAYVKRNVVYKKQRKLSNWNFPHIAFPDVKSSHWKCSIKKAVLKNLAIFSVKHLCWSLFLIKLPTRSPAIFLKGDTNTSVFLGILRNFYGQLFEKHLRVAASALCGIGLMKMIKMRLTWHVSTQPYLLLMLNQWWWRFQKRSSGGVL